MEHKFSNMAELMKSVRLRSNLSQNKMAAKLGYKNGQLISNIERGICGIPIKTQVILHKEHSASLNELYEAALNDFKETYETNMERLLGEYNED